MSNRFVITQKNLAEMKIGIMEADIDSDVDAGTISQTGVKVIQLHTGGMCHLDADMTRQGVRAMGVSRVPSSPICIRPAVFPKPLRT